MIEKILVGSGLIILPFLTYTKQVDTREPKFMLMIVLLLALTLWGFFKGIFKPVKNIWALIFLFYLGIHIILAPSPNINLADNQVGNFWLWKPLFMILLSALSIFAISSIDFKDGSDKVLLKIMSWAGFIMALYVILQWLGIEQFFTVLSPSGYSLPSNPKVSGTLGHPTIVGAFMAMIIPVSLYLKKYIPALIIILAVLLTKSHMAIGAMVVSLGFMYAIRNKKIFICFLSLLLIAGLSCGLNKQIRSKITLMSSGRIAIWQDVLKDMKEPFFKNSLKAYPLTGIGLGSFKYVFHLKHFTLKDRFEQAHNEYLELMCNIGIVGIVLFLCALWVFIKQSFSFTNRYRQSLMASFVCISLIAVGNFVWQLAPTAFYTIFVVGLLNNQSGG